MTESCPAITAARLASIASSQSATNPSGLSATPSRDNSSYATTLRMFKPPLHVDQPFDGVRGLDSSAPSYASAPGAADDLVYLGGDLGEKGVDLGHAGLHAVNDAHGDRLLHPFELAESWN